MKRTALAVLAVFCLGTLAAPAAAAGHDDFKAFQKAVKKNPAYERGREVRWLKILIVDLEDKDERVSVTLPLSLVELILGCADSRHFRVGDCDRGIDLKALYRDLKKAGPSRLLELRGEDGLIKIWLE